MRRSGRFGLSAVVLALIAALVVGCAGDSDDSGSSTSKAGGTSGGDLRLATTLAITSLDPARGYEFDGFPTLRATYDTLVEVDRDDVQKLVPGAAEKWTVDDSGTVFTFTLREGMKFASGNEVTAEDVKWSLDRVIAIQGVPSFLLATVKKVEVVDPLTVEITTSEPDPVFLSKATATPFSVLDSKLLEEHGGSDTKSDKAEQWLNQHSAGTGPYELVRWEKESEIDLKRVDTSWREGHADRVIFSNVASPATQALQIQAGDVDMAVNLDAQNAKKLQGDGTIDVVSSPTLDLFYLYLTRDKGQSDVLSNPKFVQALTQAINYDDITTVYTDSVVPGSIVPNGLLGSLPESDAPAQNLDEAKKLLAEAGYGDGVEVTLEYISGYISAGVSLDTLAQLVQKSAKDVGIDIKLKPASRDFIVERYRAGNSPFGIWQWVLDYADANGDLDFLPPGSVAERSKWAESDAPAELNELASTLKTEGDADARAEMWEQAQGILREQGPYIPLIQPSLFVASRAGVTGYVPNAVWRIDVASISVGAAN
jgi:peptide/nickel transport system substrate-binding protein